MAVPFTSGSEINQYQRGYRDAYSGVEYGRSDESTSYDYKDQARAAYRRGWDNARAQPNHGRS
jgi:hypothetical protein